MQSEEGDVEPTPAQHAAPAAGATPVADASEATWRRIDAALSPIIGPLGMAALFKRSLHLARARHAALLPVQPGEPGVDAFASLRGALAGQTGPTASEAQAALLQTFHDLLSGLIGASLTERLLRSAAAFPSSGDAAQDSTP
jgi:hypothetical protein